MSEPAEPMPLGSQLSLFDHAVRLHEAAPDAPLPRDGEPFPDNELRRQGRPRGLDQRRVGADIAAVLDQHLADPQASPDELANALRDLHVPIHLNNHIVAAALRADERRVRETGRWLVRYSANRSAAVVGLALLATDHDDEDLHLIRTIGLLSNTFGPLAAEALQRRRDGGEALLWLARRVSGWGRVYVVEALCRNPRGEARAWLLRSSCDGDVLNGYFAGKVATATHLHHAITSGRGDDEFVDHTGRLLLVMADCSGMGMTLKDYPPAPIVLHRHADLMTDQAPTVARYLTAAMLIHHLATKELGCTAGQRDDAVAAYLNVLNRADWIDTMRAGFDADNRYHAWMAREVAPSLPLIGFPTVDHGD